MKRLSLFVVLMLLLVGLTLAEGTPAGTVIENWATATWTNSAGTNNWTEVSDTTRIIMAFNGAPEITPDTTRLTGYLDCYVDYPHRIYNHGNGSDAIDIIFESSHGWSSEIFMDTDFDGTLPPSPVAYDPTDSIASDDSVGIVIRISTGSDESLWGEEDIARVIIQSTRDPLAAADTAVDITTVVGPNLSIELTVVPESPDEMTALDTLEYTLVVANAAGDTSRNATDIVFATNRPWDSEGSPYDLLFLDPEASSYPVVHPLNYTLEYKESGVWSSTFYEDADSIRFRISDPADSISPADTLEFTWYVVADSCLPTTLPGDSIWTWVRANYEDDGPCAGVHQYIDSSNVVTTDVPVAGVTIEDSLVIREGDVTDTLYFPYIITNQGDHPDIFTIELDELTPDGAYTWTDLGAAWEVYLDADMNGILGPGEMGAGTITETPEIAAGNTAWIIVRVEIPTGAAEDDSTLIRVRSTDNFCTMDSALAIGHITAPLLLVNINLEPFTAEDELDGALPDDVVKYIIKIWNVGDGSADSFSVVDSLDTFTVLQYDELDTLVRTIPAGWIRTDVAAEFNGSGAGGTWTTLVGTAGTSVGDPDPGEIMVVRFRETAGTRMLPPTTPPADPETEPGQVELQFHIRIK